MSTVKAINFQHPDAASPAITLDAGGTASVAGLPVFEAGLNATGGGSSVTVSFGETFSNPPTVVITTVKDAGQGARIAYLVLDSNNATPQVSTTEFNVAAHGSHNDNNVTRFTWLAIGL